ncbi:MAG TPA: protein kinase, partial [Polyangiaceae bacterium]|nr:protein kinase [Polyangiaceae bacterium]
MTALPGKLGSLGQGRRCVSCGERYGASSLFCPKDGTPTQLERENIEHDPYLGRVVAAQFKVERLLGIGAMARVYLAEQLGLDRAVALKILHRELQRDEGATARLRREATIGARLRHPHVAEVLMLRALDETCGAESDGAEPFIVLEYLDGMSLTSALLAQGGSLGLVRAVHVALQ